MLERIMFAGIFTATLQLVLQLSSGEQILAQQSSILLEVGQLIPAELNPNFKF